MHASWNAAIKGGADRFLSVMLLTLASGMISAVMLPFVPAPAAAAWPWIMASALIHCAYKILLVRAYALGDLSQIYPLARGSAPMIVALVSAPLLGEQLTLLDLASVAAIGSGIVLMSLRGGADLGRMRPPALGWAVATACATASYTIVDGIGARAAGTASGYILWMFVGDMICMIVFALTTRRTRLVVGSSPRDWMIGLASGAMSVGSYWIAVWAFTKAPIALVAALRETSVLFAMLIAALFLAEKATHWRWTAAVVILSGVLLMRL